MRYENFLKNEYYRVEGFGAGQQNLFEDDIDRTRFIFLLTHFQSPIRIYNVTWYTMSLFKKGCFSTGKERIHDILKHRSVELTTFIILPNSFDLIVKNLEDQILSVYMHRVLTAYGKYFSKKYKKKGHVFAGPFTATRIKSDELATMSATLHKKPSLMENWKKNYEKYPWSSYQDYIGINRWKDFITTTPILNKFKNKDEYRLFVEKTDLSSKNQ